MIGAGLVESAGIWAYVLIFALTMAETSIFVGIICPGESMVLFAAALAGTGHLSVTALAIAVITGGITGDSVGYWVGRWSARSPAVGRLRRRARRRGLPPWLRSRLPFRSGAQRAHDLMLRHGGAAVFTGRFIGFVRTFVPFAAGAAGMPYRRYVPYTVAASLLWGSGTIAVGFSLGASAGELLHGAGIAVLTGLVALVVAVLLARRIRRRSAPAAPSRAVARSHPAAGPTDANGDGHTATEPNPAG
ncbi:DedA family protein [Streptacidiphilus sp. 4-A2]|nr:DedA family protein [Streptacidiphilus sp. 4-A2]